MKSVFTKAKQVAFELGVLFANTLTTQPISKPIKK